MMVVQPLGDAAHPPVVLLRSEAMTADAALEKNEKAEGVPGAAGWRYKGCPTCITGSQVSLTRASR